jgi:hypothetical protein
LSSKRVEEDQESSQSYHKQRISPPEDAKARWVGSKHAPPNPRTGIVEGGWWVDKLPAPKVPFREIQDLCTEALPQSKSTCLLYSAVSITECGFGQKCNENGNVITE